MRLFPCFLLSVCTSVACLKHANVQCEQDSNCDLQPNGVCATAPGGAQWCAYPDQQCPSGYSYSTQAIGDGLAGTCVPGDSLPSGSKPQSCKLRVAFEDGQPWPDVPHREVWVTNIDGSEPINVSRAPTADDYGASWSPDGQKLLFLSNRVNPNFYHIYVVDADGRNLIDLTPNSLDYISAAVWSPDGARIAFVRTAQSEAGQIYPVWVMDADGANAVQVSNLSALGFVGWSPDSQNLLIIQAVNATPSSYSVVVVVLSADANHPNSQQLSICNCYANEVSWAPGHQAVWNYQYDVFTASPDLQVIRNVTEDPKHYNSRPRMSPDGRTIVFQSNISDVDREELWSIDSVGGIRTRLTRNDGPCYFTSCQQDVLNSISDDSSLVAFTRIPPPVSSTSVAHGDIGVMDIHGTNLHLFNAPNGTNAAQPVFSHCPLTSVPILHRTNRPAQVAASTLR